MTLKDSQDNPRSTSREYAALQLYETNDGTISLKSIGFNETFHSICGAKQESLDKYIEPSELYRFKKGSPIFVLDVCLGMGYNSASLIEEMRSTGILIKWWGLEIDKRPIEIALNNSKFNSNWSKDVIEFLKAIRASNKWESELIKGEVLWGDARQRIHDIPKNVNFDLIFHDAFSPQKCPELWSEEFLKCLSNRLAINGRLLTYCRAAAIRKSLRDSGLRIKSLLKDDVNNHNLSHGTIAIKNISTVNKTINNRLWRALNEKEEEHLKTNASVPYRDPNSNSSSKEILERRKKEQKSSEFMATNLWKKKWEITKCK